MRPEQIHRAILDILREAKDRNGHGQMGRDSIKTKLEERFGEKIDTKDVRYSLDYLKRHDLIYGVDTEQDGIVSAVITTDGESVARDDDSQSRPAVQYNNTFNLQGGHIGVVNNQGTIEELHVNMGSLRDKGMEDLSVSLEKMIAATTASTQLTPIDQQAMLDNLAILTEELVKPEEKRRLGAVRVIILSTIPLLIGHVADLVGLWESDLMQQLLTTFGLAQ